MSVSLKHAKTSTVPDSGDPTLVQGSDWNSEHTLQCASGNLLGRQTSGTGAVEEIPISGFATTSALSGKADKATTLSGYGITDGVNSSLLGAASGVATLGSDSKLTASQIPDISIVTYLGSVASQSAMLALTGQQGDWCTRSDLGTNWIITGSNPALLASWTQLSYPTAPVTSVNSKTGAVTLSNTDVGAQATITATGLLKGAGAGSVSAAVSGTDYAPATSGSAILKGDAAGGFANAVAKTDYAPATTGSAILKGDGAGGFSAATGGTDYQTAQSVTGIVKSSGTTRSAAVAGTDYQAPIGMISGIAKGNGANALTAATAGTDYSAGTSALATGLLKSTTITGALSIAVGGTDYQTAQSVTGLVKSSGTTRSAATAGTDYLAPPSGTAILKANSGGALANAVAGTDYTSPTGTENLSNKTITASSLNSTPIGASSASTGTFTTATVTQNVTYPDASTQNTVGYTGSRNRIINGNMAIDQRNAGAAVAVTTSTSGTYGPDRFFAYTGTGSLWNTQRVSTGNLDFLYATRLQRIAGQTSTSSIYWRQIIETANCSDLAGQSVIFSFYVTAGANYSGGAMTIQVLTGTAADQGAVSLNTGAWTGLVAPVSTTITPTTTRTRYTFTATIGASVQEIAVGVSWSGSGTAGANDYVDITGVQLEKGSTTTPFEFRSYGQELALCQRYYLQSFIIPSGTYTPSISGYGSASSFLPPQFFPVEMRTVPTVSVVNSTIQYYNGSGVWTNTTLTPYTYIKSVNGGCLGYLFYAIVDASGVNRLVGYINPGPYATYSSEL